MGQTQSQRIRLVPIRVHVCNDSNSDVLVYSHDSSMGSELVEAEPLCVAPDMEGGIVALKVWPGSMSLSRFFVEFRPDLVRGKKVIELGCGVGLPGIAVSKLCGPASVELTDRASVGPVVNASIALNRVQSTAIFASFDWGSVEDLQKFNQRVNTFPASETVVIGSELVYAEEQEPLLNAIEAVVTSTFVLAYTERSETDRTYFELVKARFTSVEQIGNIYVFHR
jgi:hypothetical protein